jgi:signal transduction histidine kinase
MLFDQGRPQDFIYLEVNRAFETLTGLQNVVGKKVSEVIPGIRETDREVFEIYGRVAVTGVPEKFETYVQALEQWFAISVYSPAKEHFVAVFDVVTERKQADTALAARTAQLEAVRAVSAEITRELELRTVLRLITQRACELTGATAGDLDLWDAERQLLVPEATYGHAAERPMLPRWLGEGAMGTVAETRQGLILNDYRTSPLAHPRTLAHTRITASLLEPLLYGDRLLGVIGVDHEVEGRTFTGRDQATLKLFAAQAAIAIENARLYRQIREHASTLEARVQERTRDLEAARNAAEAASRAKSEFLSNMSHELRTPLNSILGFAQVLQEQTAVTFSAKQVRYLTHIYSSGRRLLQIINDILDFNMVQAGKIELRPEELELPEILDVVLALTQDLATKKGHRVTLQIVGELPRLTADPIRLKQILLNLLSNAVKFTPDGGLITVVARQVQGRQGSGSTGGELFEPAPQGFVEFRVSDTGIGIKAEDLPRLFQEFEQLEPTTTKSHEGTGLGLALTRRLVELHGGRIWAESAGEGQGSTFTVILPLEGPSTPRPE